MLQKPLLDIALGNSCMKALQGLEGCSAFLMAHMSGEAGDEWIPISVPAMCIEIIKGRKGHLKNSERILDPI